MDKLSFYGIILAIVAITGSQYLETGDLLFLYNGHALLIVLGGTLGAVMLQTPFKVFRRALKILSWVFKPRALYFESEIHKVVRWSKLARAKGRIALEDAAAGEKNVLAKKGLIAIAQGIELDSLRQLLELEKDGQEYYELQAAQVYESMGGYSPTIGILGAVLGLIEVMRNLTDPAELGSGIAIAFVATLYGVGFANLFFIPVANNLKSQILQNNLYQDMLLEGLIAIAAGEHPKIIEQKLHGYIEKT